MLQLQVLGKNLSLGMKVDSHYIQLEMVFKLDATEFEKLLMAKSSAKYEKELNKYQVLAHLLS